MRVVLTSEYAHRQDKLGNSAVMLSAGRYHSSSGAMRFHITHRWLAKESAVLTVKLTRALIADFECRVFGYFLRFSRGVRDIGFSGELFLAAALSFAMLVAQVVVLWFMMRACRIHLPLVTTAVVFLILRLGTAIPNAPANVGTFHFFIVVALTFFGVDKTSATAFSIVYFGILTVPLWTLGLLAIGFSGVGWRAAIRSGSE